MLVSENRHEPQNPLSTQRRRGKKQSCTENGEQGRTDLPLERASSAFLRSLRPSALENDWTSPSNMIPLLRRRPTAGQPRRLTLSILRCNPADPASVPHLQDYALDEADGMTLFIALNDIRAHQDGSLQFDFVCRAGICGSCAMLINGRPGLACRTLIRVVDELIALARIPYCELIGDLSV